MADDEWMFTPVVNEHYVPIMMVYQCPFCGTIADKEYEKCPSPFCNKPLDPD